MSQDGENRQPRRHEFRGNLATKLDLTTLSKMTSNAAESSKTASLQNKSPLTAPKTRQQKIAEALGDSLQPKGMIKDCKQPWTPPSHASSSKHEPSQNGVPPFSKPLGEAPSAVSASQASKFPCPYTDCKRGFVKEADLRKHKMQDHDYCKICDEDFEDDEAFHKHKIMSERHITCTVCSLDFKSETGRDHKDGISADRFEAQRAAMAMVLQAKNTERAALTDSVGGSLSGLGRVPLGGSVAASSAYGGVPIEASEQPDFLTEHNRDSRSFNYVSLSGASSTTERPLSPGSSDAGTDLLSFEHDRPDALNASNLAAFNQGAKTLRGLADWPALSKHKDDVAEGLSNMSISAVERAANDIPVSPGIYAPPSVQPSKSGYSVAGEMKGIELQPNALTGEWDCPYYKCGFKALLRQDLEAHFDDRNNGHRGFEHQCPSCLKRFKTASAIMAHLESPTVRCTIRESKGFGNILHLVSGGHLNIAGRHNDGSNRLVVPKDPAKTTESMMW
ncbi:MAG: hypothetical protein Q9178_003482 [Gyalolechia marmorata]